MHVRIAFQRTCPPISHVRFWTGTGHERGPKNGLQASCAHAPTDPQSMP